MKGTCPKAEPGKLPPDALAGATEAALAYFEGIEDAEGAYARAASRRSNQMITEGFGCSKLLRDRSVTVNLIFPKMFPSASLSQHTVFVAKFEGNYWVWGIYR